MSKKVKALEQKRILTSVGSAKDGKDKTLKHRPMFTLGCLLQENETVVS